ncbi:MAG: serine/threonine protein kinase, partial [Bdellovibrionales bacterium]|nr:serine/threonine protein kinase [Bdellovibrionales bacterium]
GITYLGWDRNLELKVAIKEYFPAELASRGRDSTTISIHSGSLEERFHQHLQKFLDEGKALARFNDHPCIVSVHSFFRENNTGYLVMSYVDGITLQDFLAERGGRLPFDTTADVLMPIMDALAEVHAAGLLHRDISPDNIIINREGQVKLFDFGAARLDVSRAQQSVAVVLKRGYAPEEQYRVDGNQGAWTDVYALGATFYRCVTGSVPPEAIERLYRDTLQPPSALSVDIPTRAEAALLRSLSLRAEDRYPTVRSFQKALLGEEPLAATPPLPDASIRPPAANRVDGSREKLQRFLADRVRRRNALWAGALALCLLAVFFAYRLSGIHPALVGTWVMQVNEGGFYWKWRWEVERSGRYHTTMTLDVDGTFTQLSKGYWRATATGGMRGSGHYSFAGPDELTFHSPPLGRWAEPVTYRRVAENEFSKQGKQAVFGEWSDTAAPKGLRGKRELSIDAQANFKLHAAYETTGTLKTEGNSFEAVSDFDGIVSRGTFLWYEQTPNNLLLQDIERGPSGWTKLIE